MPITKPYYRLWRPLKGYGEPFSYMLESSCNDNVNKLSTDYLSDDRFVPKEEITSLITATHLIIRDLYEIYNYIEPCENNLSTYSHRIYELLLRTATEFEANCKGILLANGYNKRSEDLKSNDYFELASVAKLPDYIVEFDRWKSNYFFRPFLDWNTTTYKQLSWYKGYNKVKHNRFNNFKEANLQNLMNAIAGLLCILHAQIGEEMSSTCLNQISEMQSKQNIVSTGTFVIHAPNFAESEQYDFIWNQIKNESEPIKKYWE